MSHSPRSFLLFVSTAGSRGGDSVMRRIKHFLWSDDGATAVEYAVMLAMILLSVIAAIGTVGAQAGGMWGNNQTQLDLYW